MSSSDHTKVVPPQLISPHPVPPHPGGETRLAYLVRTGRANPVFFQGLYAFIGNGVADLQRLDDLLVYEVPVGKAAEPIYFRAGNFSDDLIYLTLTANGRPIRYIPVSPKGDVHIPLAIVESHPAGTLFEVSIAAPRDLTGTVVVDVGIIELDADA
jgi:assimilatory nitrate reductase catalytic subunit